MSTDHEKAFMEAKEIVKMLKKSERSRIKGDTSKVQLQ